MKKGLSLLLTTIFVILFTLSKPAEAGIIDTVQGWVSTISFVTEMVNAPGENISQLVNKTAYGALETIFTNMCVECSEASERIQSNASIPEYMKKGLAGMVDDQVVAMFKEQPRVNVVAHLANEWVPGYEKSNSVYASGYDDLYGSGISGLWSATRNIAYIGFVIIMIVIGFMIMFRNKIGGQVLVTVGNSIPRVVVALVLVTFSFAIMGLIIDLGGLSMKIVADLIFGDPAGGIKIYNPVELVLGFIGTNILNPLENADSTGLGIPSILAGVIGIAVWMKGPAIGASIILLVIAIIILGIIIVGAIKLWFVLIKAYLSLLVDLVISPLAILFGAVPGNEASAMNIFKSALRNVMVFPLAFAIVNIPYFVEDKGFSLDFPESLAPDGTGGVGTGFFIAVAKIVAIYAAASAPAILMAIIPSTVSKSSADAAAAIKGTLSGVPLVGGLFK